MNLEVRSFWPKPDSDCSKCKGTGLTNVSRLCMCILGKMYQNLSREEYLTIGEVKRMTDIMNKNMRVI